MIAVESVLRHTGKAVLEAVVDHALVADEPALDQHAERVGHVVEDLVGARVVLIVLAAEDLFLEGGLRLDPVGDSGQGIALALEHLPEAFIRIVGGTIIVGLAALV